MGLALNFTKACVSGGALFPALRQAYAERGIACLQCYATADLGHIAYESPAMEGMIVDEGVIVEIIALWPDGQAHQRLDGPGGPDHQNQGHVCAARTGGGVCEAPSRGHPRPRHCHP